MAHRAPQPLLDTAGQKLSIVNREVCEVRFGMDGAAVRLILRDEHGTLAEMSFGGVIERRQFGREQILDGAMPGVTFNPHSLAPLLQLLGTRVTSIALSERRREGPVLALTFSDGCELRVGTDDWGDPTWHLRTGRSVT